MKQTLFKDYLEMSQKMEIKTFIFFLLIIFNNDGSFKTKAEVVAECPNQSEFTNFMNESQRIGRIQDWEAYCFPINMEERIKQS
jgi:hypothetical protein